MGTATMSNTQTPIEKEKKPNIIKIISTLFQKKKKQETERTEEPKTEYKPITVTPIAKLVQDFANASIKENNDKSNEFNNFSITKSNAKDTDDTTSYKGNDLKETDDLCEKFQVLKTKDTRKIDKETGDNRSETLELDLKDQTDARSERFGSHSSQDSGYSEQEAKEDDDVIKKLEDLKISANAKEGKSQTVVIKRSPHRNAVSDIVAKPHPYPRQGDNYRQICRVLNTNNYTGGQVFVKPNSDLSEINQAISTIETNIQNFPQSVEQQSLLWQTAQEYITEEIPPALTPPEPELPEDILSEYIEMLSENYTPKVDNYQEFNNSLLNFELIDGYTATYPTPPYSENVSSPVSVNLGSPQLTNSEYTLSPGRSSPIYNSDLEKYQDMSTEIERYQQIPLELEKYQEIPSEPYKDPKELNLEKQKRPKAASASLMTMKQYKDLQKELLAEFAKLDCCQMSRKPCKEIFEEHAKKLQVEERKEICVKLTQLDTKAAYGVLQHILLSLSTTSKDEDLQCALFSLLCERVLAQRPALFLGDFGLGLLKAAALRCYRRPLLARYLAQCVRTALRVTPEHMEGRDSVFHETDALGDTLVTACARAGDACAAVLHELVRDSPPLFRLAHANTEGNTALHLACAQHSRAASRLHTVHVLLEHGKADLWSGDVKGGDTALHLAVNSSTCDLRLVMALFRHVERARWRQLAHAPNRSSVTPLEYARSQSKSISRPYPQEVLDFLKKCR